MTADQGDRPVAVVTGASAGLGRALARSLAVRGWRLVLDARGEAPLREVGRQLAAYTDIAAVCGDVADSWHRVELAASVERMGRLDLLVHNASYLGPSPRPRLVDYPIDELRTVYEVDVLAPLALTQLVLPLLSGSGAGTIVTVSSDAATQPYPGWGGYGSAKAALDQLTAVLGVEHPELRVFAFDPGDMRTAMHQRAFPGEDISDRPEPESVLPAIWRLVDERPASGRYCAADLAVAAVGAS